MRVLHLGNVANNGYLNAKLLRRVGIEADAVADERHIISQPEWEEADVDAPSDHFASLRAASEAAGWQRPDWLLPVYDPFAARRFKGQYWLDYRWRRLTGARALHALHSRLREAYTPLRQTLGADLTYEDVLDGFHTAWMHRLLLRRPLAPLFTTYEIVQSYATHPIFNLIMAPDHPWVAYEHGTLREIPFEATARGRLMSLAYRLAHKVIITNADVESAARKLGLDNYVFVPHPIDEAKYSPGPSRLGDDLRAGGADFVVLLPTRHDWREKANDRVLRAFADLVRDDRPHAVLLLTEWGTQVDDSKRLVDDLGIARNVSWLPPLAKTRLIEAYRASDVVLDQFLIGTFGGIAPEAMSCEKPVVMAFEPSLHEWCFPEQPPIASARSEEEIYAQLRRLAADDQERAHVGRVGRDWAKKYYSSGVTIERHVQIYEEILQTDSDRSRLEAIDSTETT